MHYKQCLYYIAILQNVYLKYTYYFEFESNISVAFFSSSFIMWNLRIFVIFPLTFGRHFIVRAANYMKNTRNVH